MPDPRDWRCVQMPRSCPGGGGWAQLELTGALVLRRLNTWLVYQNFHVCQSNPGRISSYVRWQVNKCDSFSISYGEKDVFPQSCFLPSQGPLAPRDLHRQLDEGVSSCSMAVIWNNKFIDSSWVSLPPLISIKQVRDGHGSHFKKGCFSDALSYMSIS